MKTYHDDGKTPLLDARGAMDEDRTQHSQEWAGLIAAMDTRGAVIRVDGAVFDYFLEVLPPVSMSASVVPGGRVYVFAFAEGCETIKGFWTEDDEDGNAACYVENTGKLNRLA